MISDLAIRGRSPVAVVGEAVLAPPSLLPSCASSSPFDDVVLRAMLAVLPLLTIALSRFALRSLLIWLMLMRVEADRGDVITNDDARFFSRAAAAASEADELRKPYSAPLYRLLGDGDTITDDGDDDDDDDDDEGECGSVPLRLPPAPALAAAAAAANDDDADRDPSVYDLRMPAPLAPRPLPPDADDEADALLVLASTGMSWSLRAAAASSAVPLMLLLLRDIVDDLRLKNLAILCGCVYLLWWGCGWGSGVGRGCVAGW